MAHIYSVISLDVWGNDEDGYEVNDAHYTGATVTLETEATDEQIIQSLINIGYVAEQTADTMNCVSISGDDEYSIYIDFDGKPDTELRLKQ